MKLELLFLLDLFTIVVLPHLVWRAARLKSIVPCAMVQLLLGILLGPSMLGAMAPTFQQLLLPTSMRVQIDGVSAISVLFFALITGLHTDFSRFRARKVGFIFLGGSSIVVPLLLGTVSAWYIYAAFPQAVQNIHDEAGFIAATAIALSVTALPVLGVILRELQLVHLPIGQWCLGLAAINDATLWLLVSMVLATHDGGSGSGPSSIITFVCATLYLAVMYRAARSLLTRVLENTAWVGGNDSRLVVVTAYTLLSAAITELLGLHYLIGAFVAGATLPKVVRQLVLDRIENATIFLLLPFFFVATGLKVTLDFTSRDFWVIFALCTTVAMAGKFVGTALPARAIGFSWHDSFLMGSLMQTKGMMELAVLTILHDTGLISNTLFSALTAMAITTTAMTVPMCKLTTRLFRNRVRPALAHLPTPGQDTPY